jgi:hypothetical protein
MPLHAPSLLPRPLPTRLALSKPSRLQVHPQAIVLLFDHALPMPPTCHIHALTTGASSTQAIPSRPCPYMPSPCPVPSPGASSSYQCMCPLRAPGPCPCPLHCRCILKLFGRQGAARGAAARGAAARGAAGAVGAAAGPAGAAGAAGAAAGAADGAAAHCTSPCSRVTAAG